MICYPVESQVCLQILIQIWQLLKFDLLFPVKSFIQHFFSDIDHRTRCLFDGVQYKDIDNMDECQEACSLHGLNMVAYLPNQPNTPASSISANPNFRPELEELKDSNGRYTKYPGCFLRKDQRGPSHPDFLGDRCIWNGNLQATMDSRTRAWQQTYWPVDPHSNFYPLCMSACPTTTTWNGHFSWKFKITNAQKNFIYTQKHQNHLLFLGPFALATCPWKSWKGGMGKMGTGFKTAFQWNSLLVKYSQKMFVLLMFFTQLSNL